MGTGTRPVLAIAAEDDDRVPWHSVADYMDALGRLSPHADRLLLLRPGGHACEHLPLHVQAAELAFVLTCCGSAHDAGQQLSQQPH